MPCPVDTIDILDAVTRTSNGSQSNQTDLNLSRISESTYITIPNKNANGRPIQMWINRQREHGCNTNYSFGKQYWWYVSATATSITVASVANLPTSGFVQIGQKQSAIPIL
jgi:hypothetical protein